MSLLTKTVSCLLCVAIGVASAEVMTITLTADAPDIDNAGCSIPGFNTLRIPGTPVLPARSVVLALPAGATVVSIDVGIDQEQTYGFVDLDPAPPSLPLSMDPDAVEDACERWEANRKFMESIKPSFPARPVYYSKTGYFRNIPFVRICYFPLLYTRQNLLFYPRAQISINYVCETTDNSIPSWVEQTASRLFSNWREMRGNYNACTRDDSFDYVIITKDNLFSAFDSLVLWKNALGHSTRLVSYDSIVMQYPGADNADRIRNFLIDKYISWGIHYLLIAGNVDAIPMKICYPDPDHGYETPTDYYFAELTDDWDSDNDGYYGEYEQDSIGFVPEIIVGRFPYNDAANLNSIARKTVHFEMDTGTWKNRALLIGSFLNFANEDNTGWPDCDGAVLMEMVKDSMLAGWTCTRLYEEEGLCPSVYTHEYALTQANVVSAWSGGNYAITNWVGHGNSSGAYRKVWAQDDGDSIPEYFEMETSPFITSYDVPSLDDAHPSIIFSGSCSNAAGDDNLARELIGHGAVGILAATTYGWYTPGWDEPSDGDFMSLDYYFYYYLIAGGERVGDAMFDSKMFYFNYLYFPDPWAPDPEWTPQQNMLDYTLFGDPSLVRTGVGIEESFSPEAMLYSFTLHPNPVTSHSSITYSIPFESDITISLFNIVGQRVGIVYQGREKAGFHVIRFEKNDLAKGVYFVRVQFANKKNDANTLTQKIILL